MISLTNVANFKTATIHNNRQGSIDRWPQLAKSGRIKCQIFLLLAKRAK
jgi:hypothetical protein